MLSPTRIGPHAIVPPITIVKGEQEIKHNIEEKSPVSSAFGRNRNIAEDREWDLLAQEYINNLQAKCKINAEHCIKMARSKRKIHTRLALPAVVIPIVMTAVTQLDDCEMPWIKNLNSAVYIFISILNAVNTYFDYSRKAERLIQSKYKYDELLEEIGFQLSKPPEFRTNVNILMSSMKHSMIALNRSIINF